MIVSRRQWAFIVAAAAVMWIGIAAVVYGVAQLASSR